MESGIPACIKQYVKMPFQTQLKWQIGTKSDDAQPAGECPETTASRLMAVAITGKGAGEAEIRRMEADAMGKVMETAEALHPDWAADIKTNTQEYRIQSGSIRRALAENERDGFTGAYNRMHLTGSRQEFVKMAEGTLYHIHGLAQLALERIGAVSIPEYVWDGKIDL